MTRQLVVAVALLFAASGAFAQQSRGAVDWIFLADTSKSMLEKNVFGAVQDSLRTFVSEARDGDTVSLYTFDRGVAMRAQVDVRANRDDLLQAIDGLQATGNRTHLGAAIAKGLDRSEALVGEDKTRVRAIVLFTDGKEDVRGIADPVPIGSNISRVQNSNPYIYFVSMGEHEQQLDQFPTAEVLKTRDIATLAQRIRVEITPQPTVVKKSAPPAPPPVPIEEPSLLSRTLPWLSAAIALAFLALIARTVLKKRNQLEGEIEIVQPRMTTDAAFVGLPTLKATEVALSSIVPADALAGTDARLFCRRKDGDKKVWISSTQGALRVNDIEVPTTELFDADTIQLGDAKLRFNRLGYARPQEDFA